MSVLTAINEDGLHDAEVVSPTCVAGIFEVVHSRFSVEGFQIASSSFSWGDMSVSDLVPHKPASRNGNLLCSSVMEMVLIQPVAEYQKKI